MAYALPRISFGALKVKIQVIGNKKPNYLPHPMYFLFIFVVANSMFLQQKESNTYMCFWISFELITNEKIPLLKYCKLIIIYLKGRPRKRTKMLQT